jgi:predicted HicB family RNase H-like nuclease|nr:MAG TPA: hypothetical protein [Caudoviricetes sp.]
MRYNKTQKEVQPLQRKELKTSKAQRDASLKWEHENNEKVTIKLRIGTDPSKAQIRAAAAAAGQSVNAWIIEAIRDKL